MNQKLSPHCEELLHLADFSVRKADDDGIVPIYDENNNWILSVPHDIEPDLLRNILRFGTYRYQAGHGEGVRELQLNIKSILGL